MMLVDPPSRALKNLSAPKLQCLSLDFGDDFPKFSHSEIQWLEEFALLWKRFYLQTRIERLYIRHSIDREVESVDEIKPWGWMSVEVAKENVAKHGLQLEYTPDWTKEEWAAKYLDMANFEDVI
ncbi:hypothetical protein F5884DRAFT_755784 [Xylogone sp. PMI_703]|nr:hypothetical protein F5884DRAFT_755784 [Xylogone sp. PMI_703]